MSTVHVYLPVRILHGSSMEQLHACMDRIPLMVNGTSYLMLIHSYALAPSHTTHTRMHTHTHTHTYPSFILVHIHTHAYTHTYVYTHNSKRLRNFARGDLSFLEGSEPLPSLYYRLVRHCLVAMVFIPHC